MEQNFPIGKVLSSCTTCVAKWCKTSFLCNNFLSQWWTHIGSDDVACSAPSHYLHGTMMVIADWPDKLQWHYPRNWFITANTFFKMSSAKFRPVCFSLNVLNPDLFTHISFFLSQKSLHLRAKRTFTDVYKKERKHGEEWLVTLADSDTHIPDVFEEVS